MDEDVASGDADNTVASKVVLLSSNVEAIRLDTTTEVVLTPLAPGGPTSDIGAVMLDTTNEAVLPPLAPNDAVQPSMGLSKISGGKLCGLAHGNVLNHADFTHTVKHLPRERSIST